MKGRKNIGYKSLLLMLLMVAVFNFTYAQSSKEERDAEKIAAIQNMVQSKNFVFVAETMNPMGGRSMFLNSVFDLRVSPDKIQSDLPYFGRAFIAPIDPTRGALQFVSEDFNYGIEPAKKGGWEVSIVPNDHRDVRQMSLSISPKGHAFLQVLSNNRQSISFNGHIEKLRTKTNLDEEQAKK
jgi:hypothetical protein